MNVLHLVSGELTGGAARGAYWLHQGLLAGGVTSKLIISGSVIEPDDNIKSLSGSKLGFIGSILREQLELTIPKLYKKRTGNLFSCGIFGADFTESDEYKQADIVHLHWINSGMLSIKILSKIDKPIVWTLRDMWPLTGGCHYSLDCERYKTGCGACPQLGSLKRSDLSYHLLNRKLKFFPKTMTVVGISNWLTAEAKNSFIFNKHKLLTIFNNINTDSFLNIDKAIARDILGVKTSKKIVLVGSTNIKDFYKGFSKFLESLDYLNKKNIILFFFGRSDKRIIEKYGFEYKNFGYLNDDISLNLVYSCADVFVAPSIQEAFGKTLAEAQCSGTPVVCFDTTGPKDLVDHKVTGYRATPFDGKDLADGINWVLNNENYEDLRVSARQKVLREFDSKVIAGKYIALYKEILST